MLEDAGLSESGLDQLARVGFDILGLQTFLLQASRKCAPGRSTRVGPPRRPAGVDPYRLRKGLHQADIVSYDDFVAADGSMAKIKEEGKLRQEGRDT